MKELPSHGHVHVHTHTSLLTHTQNYHSYRHSHRHRYLHTCLHMYVHTFTVTCSFTLMPICCEGLGQTPLPTTPGAPVPGVGLGSYVPLTPQIWDKVMMSYL